MVERPRTVPNFHIFVWIGYKSSDQDYRETEWRAPVLGSAVGHGPYASHWEEEAERAMAEARQAVVRVSYCGFRVSPLHVHACMHAYALLLLVLFWNNC